MANDSVIGQRWEVMREALDERQRRLLVGVEAKVLGAWGRVSGGGGNGRIAHHHTGRTQ